MLDVRDMTALICIYDAWDTLNTTLLGKELLVGFFYILDSVN